MRYDDNPEPTVFTQKMEEKLENLTTIEMIRKTMIVVVELFKFKSVQGLFVHPVLYLVHRKFV